MQLTDVTAIIREYGEAIRGDWGSIDGRSVRSQLDELAHAVENPEVYEKDNLRDKIGICLEGKGHWEWYCEEHGCEGYGANS